jgi:hypothetical protein
MDVEPRWKYCTRRPDETSPCVPGGLNSKPMALDETQEMDLAPRAATILLTP